MLVGYPGCGKTVQQELLPQRFPLITLESGERIREKMGVDQKFAEAVRRFPTGALLPDSFIRPLSDEFLRKAYADGTTPDNSVLNLNGIPRTRDQKWMFEQLRAHDFTFPGSVIVINAPPEICHERMLRRAQELRRKLDLLPTPERLRQENAQSERLKELKHEVRSLRLQEFRRHTIPLIKYIREQGVAIVREFNVTGHEHRSVVTDKICAILRKDGICGPEAIHAPHIERPPRPLIPPQMEILPRATTLVCT